MMGIDYGPAHRAVDEIYVGAGECLAKLSLPPSVSDTLDRFVLHPSLMDAALQASAGLMVRSGDRLSPHSIPQPALPFALEQIEIRSSLPATVWAHVRYSEGGKVEDKIQKLDIDISDEEGRVCATMRGFSTRVLENKTAFTTELEVLEKSTFTPPVGTIMLSPVWNTVSVTRGEMFPSQTDNLVLATEDKDKRDAILKLYPGAHDVAIQSKDTYEEIAQKLKEHGQIDHIILAAPDRTVASIVEDDVIGGQHGGVLQVFRVIKALLSLGYGAKSIGLTLITTQAQPINRGDRIDPTHASIHGLVGSMAKEYPSWKVRLVDLEAGCSLSDVFTLDPDPKGDSWVYRNQEWYRQTLIPIKQTQPDTTLYRQGGVYAIIGGAGGIGEALSEYLIRTYQAQVIWIGRRRMDEAIKAMIDKLAKMGPEPYYVVADATNKEALSKAYEEIKSKFSEIHGLIHSAIVLLDQSLTNMDEERFKAALSAKVDTSVRMAQVFSKEPLDFVLFFSSMQSFSKAPGQSNYAAGCTFKDAFAHQLSHEWACRVKVVNWSYWGSVGVVASKEYRERMAQAGMGSIEPLEGMQTLEMLLGTSIHQIALMKTTRPMALEGVDPEELLALYPQEIPSCIHDTKEHLSGAASYPTAGQEGEIC